MKKSLALVLLPLAGVAFASGGPINERRIECRASADAPAKSSVLVFDLNDAYSSETRGDATYFADGSQRGQTTTSLPDCFEKGKATLDGTLAAAADAELACGVERTDAATGKVTLSPNKKGYHAIFSLSGGRAELFLDGTSQFVGAHCRVK